MDTILRIIVTVSQSGLSITELPHKITKKTPKLLYLSTMPHVRKSCLCSANIFHVNFELGMIHVETWCYLEDRDLAIEQVKETILNYIDSLNSRLVTITNLVRGDGMP